MKLNLPNKITLLRLILIPIFMFFYLANFIPYGKLVAFILYMVACLTDFVDGRIARKYNLCTVFGNFFDTVADKLLTVCGIVLIAGYPIAANGGSVDLPVLAPTWLGMVSTCIIVGRELMVMALKSLASARGIVIKADMFGKVKATMQFIAVSYYFLLAFIIEEFYASLGVWNTILGIVGYVLLGVTVLLTILSAINYITKNKAIFKEDETKETN